MNDLKDRLGEIAGTPRPGGGAVDVAAAVTRGRRIKRRRRAAAGTVLAVAVAAAAVLPGLGAAPEEAASAPNPLPQVAEFGWLPDGYKVSGYDKHTEVGAAFRVYAARHTPREGNIGLTVLTPGLERDDAGLPGERPRRWTAAPRVKGRAAFWGMPQRGSTAAEFRWEYTKGSWALLSTDDSDVANVAALGRLAAGVRFGGAKPTRFPLRVAGLPADLQVSRALVNSGGTSELRFVKPGTAEPQTPHTLRIEIEPGRPPKPPPASGPALDGPATRTSTYMPNGTTGGLPSYDSNRDPRHQTGPAPIVPTRERWFSAHPDQRPRLLRIFGAHGFDITLEASGEPLARLRDTGGLPGLYRRITLLGNDPTHWTTTPLR